MKQIIQILESLYSNWFQVSIVGNTITTLKIDGVSVYETEEGLTLFVNHGPIKGNVLSLSPYSRYPTLGDILNKRGRRIADIPADKIFPFITVFKSLEEAGLTKSEFEVLLKHL